jgi:hypothetical protein
MSEDAAPTNANCFGDWLLDFDGGHTVLVLGASPAVATSLEFLGQGAAHIGLCSAGHGRPAGLPVTRLACCPRIDLLGIGIELAQALSGWRHGDWLDWLADCVGVALGVLVIQLWWSKLRQTD